MRAKQDSRMPASVDVDSNQTAATNAADEISIRK